MSNKENNLFPDDEVENVDQEKELEKYRKYLKSIQKYNPLDEEEYLYLTKEMNTIINNNKDNFTEIELLELTQKLDKIELNKDYTIELLELTKEIKQIINPEKKYNIPKIKQEKNNKKEVIKPLSTTAVLPKINNKVKNKAKEEVKEEPSKKENKSNGQLTFKELVDKNSESAKIKHFATTEIKKLQTVSSNVETSSKKKEVSKKERVIWSFTFAISVVVFAFLCIRVIIWKIDNKMSGEQIKNIYEIANIEEVVSMGMVTDVTDNDIQNNTPAPPPLEETPSQEPSYWRDDYWYYMSMSMLNANFNELKAINPDTVGWVQVAGTNINYPYVQGSDNNFYLKHSFNRQPNGSGWVFLDYRNDKEEYGKNNILYAHARLDNTMFGSLRMVVTPSWYNNSNNYVVKTSTPKYNALWQVFSVYTILPESYYIKTKFSDEEFATFLNTITARSVHDFKVNLSPDDKILTLSSCYDNERRVVLHAKMIRLEEK